MRAAAGLEVVARSSRRGPSSPSGRGCRLLGRLGRAAVAVVFAGALEQRIALELPLDIGGQIQVRELQQLDGLHQLRRHHERLALPDFESVASVP